MRTKSNSIDVLDLFLAAAEKGVSLFLNNGKLSYSLEEGKKVDAEFIKKLKLNKEEIVRFLQSELGEHKSNNSSVEHIYSFDRNQIKRIPLSYSQERLWFLDKLQGSSNYHIPSVRRLSGQVDPRHLELAFQSVINRHEILRTIYLDEDGKSYQKILPPNSWHLDLVDKSNASTESVEELVNSTISRSFDLSKDHMIRVQLIQLKPEEYLVIVVFHHIACDGWSIPIFTQEFFESHEAIKGNKELSLKPLKIQYADYAVWQRQFLNSEMLESKLAYWDEKLSGLQILKMPLDFKRPAIQSDNGNRAIFKIEQKLTTQLNELAKREGATLFMLLLAAYKVLLHKYSGQNDICIGTPLANRTQQETEPLIGFFVNTLPIRSEVNGNMKFLSFLKQLKVTALEAFSLQHIPFEKIVKRVDVDRASNQSPIFQTLFTLQNNLKINIQSNNGEQDAAAVLTNEKVDVVKSKFDLTFTLNELQDGILGSMEYCSDLFLEDSIERMMGHYKNILQEIVENPNGRIAEIGMLSSLEEKELLQDFNDNETFYPADKTLVELFEAQASVTPDNVALVFGEKRLTYREVKRITDSLANYLQSSFDVKKNELIGIMMERSLLPVLAILGVLKSGAAYVPIDPDNPVSRKSFIIKDAALNVLITESRFSNEFSNHEINLILFDTLLDGLKHEPLNNNTLPRPADLAYVIYTSGSTGNPKGCLIQHKSILNYIFTQRKEFGVNENDRILLASNLAFDASLEQMFLALTSGAALYIIDKKKLLKGELLTAFIEDEGITHIHMVPSLLSNLPVRNYSALKRVIAGGEICPKGLARKWGRRFTFYNEYGPTETTVSAAQYKFIDEEGSSDLPIGQPIANYNVYILDEDLNLVPKGAFGEICVGGIGLAKGYLNRPELTAKHFLKNPFNPEERIYKTGDIGRWSPDGQLEIAGRKDSQVKIRGYRIELGEIESVLLQSDDVEQCAVIISTKSESNKLIVAYVVTNDNFNVARIQEYLKAMIPAYMIPAVFVEMEELPLTLNGKINKMALPDPFSASLRLEKYVAPKNETEEALVNIWGHLIDHEKIGTEESFFELGGHSLLAMQLIARINNDFGSNLSVDAIFKYPNISAFAQFMNSGMGNEQGLLLKLGKSESKPAIFLVPGAEGLPLSFYELAKAMEETHTVYSFQSPGLYEDSALPKSVEDLASLYITELKKLKELDPLVLGGYSFGGLVAFEMARQLSLESIKVKQIVLFDSLPPSSYHDSSRISEKEWLARFARHFLNLHGIDVTSDEINVFGQSEKETMDKIYGALMNHGVDIPKVQLLRFSRVFVNNVTMEYPFEEIKLAIPILLFAMQSAKNTKSGDEYYCNQWRNFTSLKVKNISLPGNHWTILKQSNVDRIKENLFEVL